MIRGVRRVYWTWFGELEEAGSRGGVVRSWRHGMTSSGILSAFALARKGTGSFSEVRQTNLTRLTLMERGGGSAQMIMAK